MDDDLDAPSGNSSPESHRQQPPKPDSAQPKALSPLDGNRARHPSTHPSAHSSLTGKLLVSPPWMDDPHFARSVVLLLAHTDDGAFGVVLNDESTTGVDTIEDVVGPAWTALLAPPESIFVGGPCQTSSVIALGTVQTGPETWEVTVVDLTRDAPQEEVARIRLFAGYAGWAPMQLEAELERGGWYVAESSLDDALTTNPDALWEHIMERNGNPYARMPNDPRLN